MALPQVMTSKLTCEALDNGQLDVALFAGALCNLRMLLEMLFVWLPQLRDIDHFCKDTESHLHNPLLANRCFIVHLVLKMCDKMAKICFFSF